MNVDCNKISCSFFDIEQAPILLQAKQVQIQLQDRMTIPDMESFRYFESNEGDDAYFEYYNDFKCDPNYHLEYKTQKGDGTKCTDIRLRRKEEIVKQNDSQSVAYNVDLVYVNRSGHYIKSSVIDNSNLSFLVLTCY